MAATVARRMTLSLKITLGIMLAFVLLAAGCAEEKPGSPAVYAEIESSTDCAWLQQSFDQAAENNDRATAGTEQFDWTLGYMKASDSRMHEIGCF